MKVLVPQYKEEQFVTEVIKSYQPFCEVKTSFNTLWLNKGNYDIIHLHWPEYLFKWEVPTDTELLFLERVLTEWQQEGTKIVVTRHNYLPHRPNPERYIPLYNLVYKTVDAVIHMGKHSELEYLERYKNLIPKSQIQAQIPHPIFTNYPNNVSKEEARKQLQIKKSTTVMLVFGEVRKADEKNLVLKAFDFIDKKDKLLLVPGWKFSEGKEPINRLKWFKVQQSKKYKITKEFIPDGEVQFYFKAADFVFLPRVNTLNSGVPFLAAYFNTPLLRFKTGNISNTLKNKLKLIFDYKDQSELSKAIHYFQREKFNDINLYEVDIDLYNFNIGTQHINLFNLLVQNLHNENNEN